MDHSSTVRQLPGSKNAVVLIHGIVSTPRHFDFLMDVIPADWSVYNLLLDGHGGSIRDFSRTRMSIWQRQAREAVDNACKLHQNVILVGFSLGCLLMMENACAHPQVKGLLLMNPPLVARVKLSMWIRCLRFAFGKPRLQDPVEKALWDDISVRIEPWLWKYLGWLPRFWELLVQCRKTRPLVRQLKMPCKVFWSEKDELVSPRAIAYFQNMTNVSVTAMPKGGHSYYPPEGKQAMRQAFAQLMQEAVCE